MIDQSPDSQRQSGIPIFRSPFNAFWGWGLDSTTNKGRWEFVLTDFRFIPGVTIKDGVLLVTAINVINPLQQMAMMTPDLKEARERLPQALEHIPVLRKPFRLEQVLRLLRQPVLPL